MMKYVKKKLRKLRKKKEEQKPKSKKMSVKKIRELYYSGQRKEARARYQRIVDNFANGKRAKLPKIAAVRTGTEFWNLRFVHKHKIAFLLIPKNACTSISHGIYEIDTGEEYPVNAVEHIHKYYHPQGVFTNINDYDDYFKFVVVRDPIKRFVSAFRNRVCFHKDLHGMDAPSENLTPDPSLNYFIENLAEYVDRSTKLEMHVMPQCVLFNRRLDLLDAVFPIEEVPKLEGKLSEIIGEPFSFPRQQTGGPEMSLADLTPASFEKLLSFYAEDYALLSDYYTEAAIRNEYVTAISSKVETI